MIITDTQKEIKDMIKSTKRCQASLASEMGVSKQVVSEIVTRDNQHGLSKSYVKLAERMGYDIELRFVPREVA